MSPLRYLDCLGKYFEVVISRYKKWSFLGTPKTTFESTPESVNSFDAKQ